MYVTAFIKMHGWFVSNLIVIWQVHRAQFHYNPLRNSFEAVISFIYLEYAMTGLLLEKSAYRTLQEYSLLRDTGGRQAQKNKTGSAQSLHRECLLRIVGRSVRTTLYFKLGAAPPPCATTRAVFKWSESLGSPKHLPREHTSSKCVMHKSLFRFSEGASPP